MIGWPLSGRLTVCNNRSIDRQNASFLGRLVSVWCSCRWSHWLSYQSIFKINEFSFWFSICHSNWLFEPNHELISAIWLNSKYINFANLLIFFVIYRSMVDQPIDLVHIRSTTFWLFNTVWYICGTTVTRYSYYLSTMFDPYLIDKLLDKQIHRLNK